MLELERELVQLKQSGGEGVVRGCDGQEMKAAERGSVEFISSSAGGDAGEVKGRSSVGLGCHGYHAHGPPSAFLRQPQHHRISSKLLDSLLTNPP